jgi:hypothetical protein
MGWIAKEGYLRQVAVSCETNVPSLTFVAVARCAVLSYGGRAELGVVAALSCESSPR